MSVYATRKLRQERLDRGLCGECGMRPPKLDKCGLKCRVCEECAAARLEYYRTWRAEQKAARDEAGAPSVNLTKRCACGLLLPCFDCPKSVGIEAFMVGAEGNLSGG